MKRLFAVLYFLCTLSTVACLNVGRPKESSKGKNDHELLVREVAPISHGQTSRQGLMTSAPFDTKSACSGSGCLLNATNPKVLAASSKLVWFYGCSLDHDAVKFACENAGAPIMPLNDGGLQAGLYCFSDGMTLVFSFHPGATPPPYFHYFDSHPLADSMPQDIFRWSLEHIQGTFGKRPDAIVVDSSLWDLANWWTATGSPGQHWDVPHAKISNWCHATVPKFLEFLHETSPGTHIAFRSPAPVQKSGWEGFLCRGPEVMDEMYSCLLKSVDMVNHQLYGKYSIIDYMKAALAEHKVLGGALKDWFRDDIHPGRELALAYMAVALAWAKGLSI